jgi:uncharacterized repeat protein (TIGR02543 family)
MSEVTGTRIDHWRRRGILLVTFSMMVVGINLSWGATVWAAASTISEAATFPVNAESSGLTTLAIDPQGVGDIIIFQSQIHSESITVTGVSSPKTGAWSLAERYLDPVNTSYPITEEVWWAIASSTGSTTISVTYSGSVASLSPELVADSFTTSTPSTWSVVAGNGAAASASPGTTSIVFPNLVSNADPDQLYWGYVESGNTASAGNSSNFTYSSVAFGNLMTSNDSLVPNTSYSPDAFQGSATHYTAIGTIFDAVPSVSHTVTFDANGATGGSMAPEVANTPTALTANAFTRTNYSFTGWNTSANGTGTSYANRESYSFSKSLILYALWVFDPHIVRYVGNGATGGSMAPEVANTPTALTANAFTRTNYSFTGWNTSANGTGTSYAAGASYPFSADVTLYAQWLAILHASRVVGYSITGATRTLTVIGLDFSGATRVTTNQPWASVRVTRVSFRRMVVSVAVNRKSRGGMFTLTIVNPKRATCRIRYRDRG